MFRLRTNRTLLIAGVIGLLVLLISYLMNYETSSFLIVTPKSPGHSAKKLFVPDKVAKPAAAITSSTEDAAATKSKPKERYPAAKINEVKNKEMEEKVELKAEDKKVNEAKKVEDNKDGSVDEVEKAPPKEHKIPDHALSEEMKQNLAKLETKQQETEILEAESKTRKAQIAEWNENLQNQKVSNEIKIDLQQYDAAELKDIDISNGNKPFHDFMGHYFDALLKTSKSFDHPDRELEVEGKPYIESAMLIDGYQTLNEEVCKSFLHFQDDFISDLYKKHFTIVSQIPDKLPLDFYRGDGYAVVGGGQYSWFAYLTIKMLRRVGSVLPVEVIIPLDEEYETEFCETLLPELNAKCVVLSTVFGKKNLPKLGNLNGYQYKSLALIASSFLNTFLLDSDAFPVSNPDPIFRSELFNKVKMVSWPDFWRRTVSPYYYEVAGVDVGTKQSRYLNDFFTSPELIQKGNAYRGDISSFSYHDREGTIPDWSSESGELLLNKKEHFNTLLLSLYYNFNGPKAYHPLLSQGGAGEGDKETFVAAATYYKKPFYQNYKVPDKIFGFFKFGHRYVDSTLIQYDPIVDFDLLVKNVDRVTKEQKENENVRSYLYRYDTSYRLPFNRVNSKPMFYHVHDPKLDPFKILERRLDRVINSERKLRIMGHERINVDFDVELILWELMVKTLCVDNAKFEHFKAKDTDRFCSNEFGEHLDYLKATTNSMVTDLGDIFAANPEMQKIQGIMKDYEISQPQMEETKKFIFAKMGVQG